VTCLMASRCLPRCDPARLGTVHPALPHPARTAVATPCAVIFHVPPAEVVQGEWVLQVLLLR
jgi:hypothetical protein